MAASVLYDNSYAGGAREYTPLHAPRGAHVVEYPWYNISKNNGYFLHETQWSKREKFIFSFAIIWLS